MKGFKQYKDAKVTYRKTEAEAKEAVRYYKKLGYKAYYNEVLKDASYIIFYVKG